MPCKADPLALSNAIENKNPQAFPQENFKEQEEIERHKYETRDYVLR